MKKLEFTTSDIQKLVLYNSTGTESHIWRDKDKAYKIFINKNDIENKRIKLERMDKRLDHEIFTTPRELLYHEGEFIGYAMPLHKFYNTLYWISNSDNYKAKLQYLKLLKAALVKLHQENAVYVDLNPSNIMYDPKKTRIKLIDMDNIAIDELPYDTACQTARKYIEKNGFDQSVDTYMLNILTLSLLLHTDFNAKIPTSLGKKYTSTSLIKDLSELKPNEEILLDSLNDNNIETFIKTYQI